MRLFLSIVLLVLLFISTTKVFKKESQKVKNALANAVGGNVENEEEKVIEVVKQMFDAMRAGDSTALKMTFFNSIRLTSIGEKDGKTSLREEDAKRFIAMVGTPHDQIYDERISSYEVKIDDKLATVWTDYSFYIGDKFSHCGVNAFQLVKTEAGWKVFQISDTRRKENCKN
jgi:hypothetical protein